MTIHKIHMVPNLAQYELANAFVTATGVQNRQKLRTNTKIGLIAASLLTIEQYKSMTCHSTVMLKLHRWHKKVQSAQLIVSIKSCR